MPRDLHVDMDELAREIKLVDKAFAAAVKRNLRKAVTESGAEITAAIRAEASWSKRIPGATSLAMSFGARTVGVRVRTNAKKAPHARPFEFGNANGYNEDRVQARVSSGRALNRRAAMKQMSRMGDSSRLLRHPVFHGKGEPGGFASMPTRPFFFAAVKATTPAVEMKIQAAIDMVAIEAGFKGR